MKLKKNENRASLKNVGVTDMSIAANLVVLTPAFVGISLYFLRRLWLPGMRPNDSQNPNGGPQSFFYPSGVAGVTFVAAIVIPVIALMLPDSVVMDARPLFNLSPCCFSFAGSILENTELL
ncbi:hypothetical protein ACGYTX_08305 [Burkholderia pseudomallei]